MLFKNDILRKYSHFENDMPVFTRDGEKLGKVVTFADDYFIVQKGMFFPKDFTVRYDDIQDIRDNNIYLSVDQAYLEEWKDASYAGWTNTDQINEGRLQATPRDEYRDRYASSPEDINVPLMEEKLEAHKTIQQSGRVQLRKVVHTEYKHFTVPVLREELKIERGTTVDENVAQPAEIAGAFKEQTIDIPLMEEKVTVSKRPVVKENVRVSKERLTEEREIAGDVRSEEIQIDKSEDPKRKAG